MENPSPADDLGDGRPLSRRDPSSQPRARIFWGWCMGGVIAFEMAQQLISGGEKVALLVLIDCLHIDRAAAYGREGGCSVSFMD
jgi:hypothetical protein